MSDTALPEESWGMFDLDLPLTSLAALGEAPGLTCGPLSPLLRLPRPAGAADEAGLRELLAQAQSLSPWLMPTLLDPGLTASFLIGEEDLPALRQFAWPDPQAGGPGLEVTAGDTALHLAGPQEMPELRRQFTDLLQPGELPDLSVVAMTLSAADFWALAALADAYRMTLAARRASRQGGRPGGVLLETVLTAWRLGLQERNPGWAVTLFSLLAPEAVPQDFAVTLRATLEAMDEADLVVLIEGDEAAADPAMALFGDGLRLLISGLARNVLMFGLCLQRRRDAGSVEVTRLGGWRLPSAVWLADLSEIAQDRVELILASREYLQALIGEVLAGEAADLALPPTYSAELLLEQLGKGVAGDAGEISFCSHCRTRLEADWSCCPKCQTPRVRRAVP